MIKLDTQSSTPPSHTHILRCVVGQSVTPISWFPAPVIWLGYLSSCGIAKERQEKDYTFPVHSSAYIILLKHKQLLRGAICSQ